MSIVGVRDVSDVQWPDLNPYTAFLTAPSRGIRPFSSEGDHGSRFVLAQVAVARSQATSRPVKILKVSSESSEVK